MTDTLTRRLFVCALPIGLALTSTSAAAQNRRSQNGSSDMAPAVLPNDVVRLARFNAEQARVGDIVVYAQRLPERDYHNHVFMKRIMALPGQRIAFRDSVPILDGIPAVREYVSADDLRYEAADPTLEPGLLRYRETLAGRTYDTYHWPIETRIVRTRQIHANGEESVRSIDMRNADEVVIPAGHLFVVGDNRDNSRDSRWDGPIAITSVRRRAVAILSSRDPTRVGAEL